MIEKFLEGWAKRKFHQQRRRRSIEYFRNPREDVEMMENSYNKCICGFAPRKIIAFTIRWLKHLLWKIELSLRFLEKVELDVLKREQAQQNTL